MCHLAMKGPQSPGGIIRVPAPPICLQFWLIPPGAEGWQAKQCGDGGKAMATAAEEDLHNRPKKPQNPKISGPSQTHGAITELVGIVAQCCADCPGPHRSDKCILFIQAHHGGVQEMGPTDCDGNPIGLGLAAGAGKRPAATGTGNFRDFQFSTLTKNR